MKSMRPLGIFIAIATTTMFTINGWLVMHPEFWGLSWQPDKFLHGAAGMLLALFAGFALFSIPSFSPALSLPRWALFAAFVATAALGGVLWEFWEYAWDFFVAVPYHTFLAQPTVDDTMRDLLADVAGGVVAGAIFLLFVKRTRLQ